MSVFTGILAFTILWIIVLFVILPIGVRTPDEEGRAAEQGHATSAPVNPRLGLKFMVTTAIAGVLFALLWYLLKFDPFGLEFFAPARKS